MSDTKDESVSDESRLTALVAFCEKCAPGAEYGVELLTIQREEHKLGMSPRILWWTSLAGLIKHPANNSEHRFARRTFDVFADGLARGDSILGIITWYLGLLYKASADKENRQRQKFHERCPGVIEAGRRFWGRYAAGGERPALEVFKKSREYNSFIGDLKYHDPEEFNKLSQAKLKRAWTEVRKLCKK